MTETETTGTPVAISSHIAIIDGKPTTTTLDIAEVYGKQHAKVLSIVRQRMAEVSEGWRLANFGETVVQRENPSGGAPIASPVIRLTKKAFHFVVGKFTGAKAVQHQIAFADEFERMESALNATPAIPSPYISAAQRQELRELVQLVVESGKQGHGETWNRLHRKMKVTSYKLLPPDRFDDAVAYLQGKMDEQSMAALVQKHFPDAVKALPTPAPEPKQDSMDFSYLSLKNKRLLLSYDHNGKELIQRVPNDAMLATWEEVANILREHYLMVSLPQITEIINAGCDAIVKRMQGKMIAA